MVSRPPGDPVPLLFRHALQSRLERLFARGQRVLDVGCGAGEEAAFLASRGVSVVAIDPRRFEVAGENAALAGSAFDGAFASFGGLEGRDLRAAGTALAAVLRPGAPVLVALRGPWPLPATVRRLLTGAGEARRPRWPRLTGAAAPPACLTLAEARRALGPSLEWTDAYALGVVLPGPGEARWAAVRPQAFGLLAALDRLVRRWPGLRALGDHLVLEGRRRPSR